MKAIIRRIAAWFAKTLPTPIIRLIYNIKPLAHLIRQGLNFVSPSGLTEIRIAGGYLEGYLIQLDMQVDKDYWLGTYERDLQEAVAKIIPSGAVIYDVGANIGYISLLLGKISGKEGRVFAFEALPSNLAQLRRNIKLNNAEDQISVVPSAVTAVSGRLGFLVHSSSGMGKVVGSKGRDDLYISKIDVDGVALDDFVYKQGNPAPQVIKMDIEGGEVLALPGMKRLLEEAHPIMLMELHGPESSKAAWDALTSAGYKISWLRRGFPAVPSLHSLGWKAYILARIE